MSDIPYAFPGAPRGTVLFEPEVSGRRFNYLPEHLHTKCSFHHYHRDVDGSLLCLMGQRDTSRRGGWGHRNKDGTNQWGHRGNEVILYRVVDQPQPVAFYADGSPMIAWDHVQIWAQEWPAGWQHGPDVNTCWKRIVADMPAFLRQLTVSVL